MEPEVTLTAPAWLVILISGLAVVAIVFDCWRLKLREMLYKAHARRLGLDD